MKTNLLFLGILASLLWAWNCKDAPEASDKPVPIHSIQVSPGSLTLAVGDSLQVEATPAPAHADPAEQPFRWESAGTAVATVSASGMVTAVAAGTTTITVSARQHVDVSRTIPVTVTTDPGPNPVPNPDPEQDPDPEPDDQMPQISTIRMESTQYNVETLNFTDVAPGVRWHKFKVPEFTNGFGTFGKGLVVNAVEVDVTQAGNKVEVCPASQATLGNVERPGTMYARKEAQYNASGRKPVVAINGDFFLLPTANITGHPQINNRPYGMEIGNGMLVQTPFQHTGGFVIKDNGTPAHGTVSFSGTAAAGGKTFPITEVNGYAGEGQLVLFNGLSNSYGESDSAHAWSPYSSTMVSLSQPQGGWRVNSPMSFTVTGIAQNIKAKDFNGEGAILVGSGFGNPNQTLAFGSTPQVPHGMTVTNGGAYWELNTTGEDPFVYTALTSGVNGATAATFSFEYQSDPAISNMQIFYGKPGADANAASPANLILNNTGINAADESKWRTFTLNLKPAIDNYQWGNAGHTLRLDIGTAAGNHVLIRNMRITGSDPASGADAGAFLSALGVGQTVSLTLNVKLNNAMLADSRLNVMGCQNVILQNGTSINTWDEAHPRTAVGYSQNGRKVYLVVVDGRQNNYSAGATTGQVGDIIKALGAYTAVNLDGGGSSCMVLDVNGTATVVNKPSDGSPRGVANGVMVTVNK